MTVAGCPTRYSFDGGFDLADYKLGVATDPEV